MKTKEFKFTKKELIVLLRNCFIAGEEFQSDYTDFEMGETEEITKPDFGEWLKEDVGIEL